jgi:hypothetical protein
MIHIELKKYPPKQAWLDKAKIVETQLISATTLVEKHKIIDKNEKLWSELKEHLRDIRNKKCWYTESISDGAHCHVDHFRPKKEALDEIGKDKGGYWWLAFQWINYRYSGPAANVRKKSYFPVFNNKAIDYGDSTEKEEILLLDPIILTDTFKIGFDIEGKAQPRSSDKNSVDYKRAYYSIEKYYLNKPEIKISRGELYKKVNALIGEISDLLDLEKIKNEHDRVKEISRKMEELKQLANPDMEYAGTVRFCLRACGHDWGLDIAISA